MSTEIPHPSTLKKCHECGREIAVSAKICSGCGAKHRIGCFGKLVLTILGLFAFLAIISNVVKPSPPDKIARANQIMRSKVADDVTITIESGSEKLFESNGHYYYVCGRGIVNQPQIIDHKIERFIIIVNDDRGNGLAIFDGLGTTEGKLQFQENWNHRCQGYVLPTP